MPLPTNVTREYTVNLHKRVFGTQFKKRAPKALKVIRKFVSREMHTEDVRIDPAVNKFCWAKGVRMPPTESVFAVPVESLKRSPESFIPVSS
ncbi:hypothetical protein GEMRC1_006447 [Eukaryota sp. GEM-RC1]